MRLHQLSRDKRFLIRGCALILGGSILVCWIIQFFRSAQPLPPGLFTGATAVEQLRENYRRLQLTPAPAPGQLAGWLRQAASLFAELTGHHQNPGENGDLQIFQCDLPALITQHTRSPEEKQLFIDYSRCRFSASTSEILEAQTRLEQASRTDPPRRYAPELLGDLKLLNEQHRQALISYLQEAAEEDAFHSRHAALTIALALEDTGALAQLVHIPQFFHEATAGQLHDTARLLENRGLLWQSHLRMAEEMWTQPIPVAIALLATVIWSAIFISSSGRRSRDIPLALAALLCGIISVWLLRWWMDTLDYGLNEEQQLTTAHAIFQWIMYVGVPEETAKLLLILPLLPWLHRGSQAALAGAAVGLGFALQENLHYFASYGEAIALGRLLTANFMHASLTGLLGWQLHDLVRSRFHRAGEFLAVFLILSVAHGLYDFFSTDLAYNWGGEILAIVILAFCARYFIHHLSADSTSHHRAPLSRTCVFLFGASLLAGLLMIVLTWQNRFLDIEVITPMLRSVLTLIPIALIYVREFREVH